MDELKYKISTFRTIDSQVLQEIEDPMGNITRRVADVCAAQMDAAFAAELIRLGWRRPGVMDSADMDNGFRNYPWTYTNQPGNVGASMLGGAARRARPGGDSIDHGLSLLRELHLLGFGIVRVEPLEK